MLLLGNIRRGRVRIIDCIGLFTGGQSDSYNAPKSLIEAPKEGLVIDGRLVILEEELLIVWRLKSSLEGIEGVD
jgi:hypothetical protein